MSRREMIGIVIPLVAIGAIATVSLTARARGSNVPSSPEDAGDDARRDRDPDVAPPHQVNGTLAERAEHVRQLAFMIGAPPAWADTLALIARGESGGNPNRMLGIKLGAPKWAEGGGSSGVEKQEAAAAKAVYKTGSKHVGDCGWAADLYDFGSGGLYAILPMSGIKAFWDDPVLRCLHPWSIFDEKIATIMAAHFARRLQLRKGYQGTVASLRRGWGIPGGMASVPAAKLAKWKGHAQDIGLAPAFLDSKLPPWKPIPASEMFAAVSGDAQWLPNPELYYQRVA